MNRPVFEHTLRTSRAFGIILKDIERGAGHAYMLVSPDDESVKEFFTLTAAALFCPKRGCMECTECHKVLTDNHPDVFNINTEGEKIKVQQIRDMVTSVSVKSLSGTKAYFIHRADLMTPDAQNKLLKTLEEPPAGVSIFLGAANEAGLLDTVKSRCRRIYLDVFDRGTVYEALLGLDCGEKEAAVAAACSDGQLGKARKIAMSAEYAGYYSDALALLETLRRSADVLSAEAVPSLNRNPAEFLKMLTVAVRDVTTAKTGGRLFFDEDICARLRALADRYSLRALALVVQAINDTQKKLYYGVNSLAAADSLFFDILEVRHTWQQ